MPRRRWLGLTPTEVIPAAGSVPPGTARRIVQAIPPPTISPPSTATSERSASKIGRSPPRSSSDHTPPNARDWARMNASYSSSRSERISMSNEASRSNGRGEPSLHAGRDQGAGIAPGGGLRFGGSDPEAVVLAEAAADLDVQLRAGGLERLDPRKRRAAARQPQRVRVPLGQAGGEQVHHALARAVGHDDAHLVRLAAGHLGRAGRDHLRP